MKKRKVRELGELFPLEQMWFKQGLLCLPDLEQNIRVVSTQIK